MKRLLISSIIGCTAAATSAVVLRSPAEVDANSTSTCTQWLCQSCDHAYSMTAAEVAVATQRTHSDHPPVYCPSCGKMKSYRARVCGACTTVYFGTSVPGSTGICPKCHWGMSVDPSLAPRDHGERKSKTRSDEAAGLARPVRAK